ncbi:MAG: TonB-dependent receptor [Alphaproteobacteria bacterium]|nr:TonB-dependent receptor [Alphaproteobacteria bacterium]
MRHLRLASACFALAAIAPGAAFAESAIQARLLGPDGRPAAGVVVRAENTGTGATREARSDASGRVRFGGLDTAGAWLLRTPETGATAAFESDPIRLRTDFQSNVTLRLSAAGTGEIVVTGRRTIAGLNTANAEVSATLDAEAISKVPVEARSLERLLFRLPGVTQSTGFFPEAPAVAINGANALFTSYLIDGLDNTENFLGGQRFPIPVGAVQDVTVLSGSYSAAFGRTANGVVNVTTPAGGNDLHGEIYAVTRLRDFITAKPDSNLTSLFGAPVSETFTRDQGGVSLSGPIVRDRTFFFLNVEYIRDATDNVLSAPALGVRARLQGLNTQTLVTARVDQVWTPRLRTALRVNYGDVQLERQGGGLTGGVTFPSAGSIQDRQSLNVALTATYRGDGFDYAGALQFSRFDWDYGQPRAGAGPQVSLFAAGDLSAPIAVIGHPGFVFDDRERTWQTRHVLTIDRGAHRVRAGFDHLHADFQLFGGGNPNGNFNVALTPADLAGLQGRGLALSARDLPATAQILSASFETQPSAFGAPQELTSAFIEDQWQATADLSLTLGLRWDYDSLTEIVGRGDRNNFAPRLGFNYTPSETLAIRGGLGLFVEKIPYAIISDAIQQNSRAPGFLAQLQTLKDRGLLPANTDIAAITTDRGNITVDAASLCASLTACPDPRSLIAQRNSLTQSERRIFNPNGLDNPEAIQASLGVQWQPADRWLLGADLLYSDGRNLVRLRDLNAPAPFVFNEAEFARLGAAGVAALTPQQREALGLVRSRAAADATRPALAPGGVVPAGGARSIVVSETRGRSKYEALTLSARRLRGEGRWDGVVYYTLSRLRNDSDDINFRANDANDFAADYGPSLNDRTHVISALVNAYPTPRLTISLAALVQSGQPVTFVPDPAVFGTTDLNGDGLSFADQFTGNPDRFPGVRRNSGRLDGATTIDLGASYRIPAPRGTVEVRGDIFNLFDAQTQSGYPVNFTVSNQRQIFGRPFAQNSAGPPRTFQVTARYSF